MQFRQLNEKIFSLRAKSFQIDVRKWFEDMNFSRKNEISSKYLQIHGDCSSDNRSENSLAGDPTSFAQGRKKTEMKVSHIKN